MTSSLLRLIALVRSERAVFVGVNVAVSLFLLVRSYVTMQVLDYGGLGLAALLQTLVMLIGMLQLGMLTGGFRRVCDAPEAETARINNLIYSYLAVLSCVGLAVAAAVLGLRGDALGGLVALLGVVGGVATLARSWLTSRMMVTHQYRRVNWLNLVSGGVSAATLVFIPVNPLAACLAAIVVQPVAFVVAALLRDPKLAPTGFEASWPLALSVAKAGFVTFLTTLFLQANLQIERWYIVGELSLEALGRLYLATVFLNLFQMVPNSLDQLFLPSLARARGAGDAPAFATQMRQAILTYGGYCLATGIAVALLAGPVVDLILPQYRPDLLYVYLVLPGLLLMTATHPTSLLFPVLLRFRHYFIAYGGSTVVTVLGFGAALAAGHALSLAEVTLVRSAAYAFAGIVVLYGWWVLSREVPGARPNLLPSRP